ncbi:MAG: phosphotransferase, partial [Oceanospirillales bacterium]|nr:phosphotransferase [Oceanospirillales bacterium]
FVDIARHWHAEGVRVPALVALDLDLGFMLLEDFGDQLLLPALSIETADALYGQAFSALEAIQSIEAAALPDYDEALLRREMDLFDEWFVGQLLRLDLTETDVNTLEAAKKVLVASAESQPQVSVHRDYHSRNLMLIEEGDGLGIIDFQDAVRGPVTYDLVSLLRDSYVRWPDERVSGWVEGYRQRLKGKEVPVVDEVSFLKQFDFMGMQRQLKVLGIFSRLYLRDGKSGYLNDIPRTLGYLYRAAARYPESAELYRLLDEKVVPALAAHTLFDAQALTRELG